MSRPRRLLPFVLLVAFVLRLVAAVAVERVVTAAGREFLVEGDANGYWELARNLRHGSYSVYDPPRYAVRMPGFPLLLAFGQLTTGSSRLGVRLELALLGTLTCLLVYLLGREVADEATALVAAAATAVSPVYAGLSVLVLSETAFAAAMLACLWGFARLTRADGPQPVLAIGTGLLAAAAIFVRPSWLLAVPAFVLIDLVLAANRTAAVRRGGLVLLGTIVAITPWAVRNGIVLGRFVPTTTWLGPTLYDGFNPDADGTSDMRFYENDRAAGRLDGLDEVEIDSLYRRRSWEFVRSSPSQAVALAGRKQLRFWSPWLNAEAFRGPVARVGMAAVTLPLFVLAGCGAWQLRRRPVAFWATVGPLLYFAVLHCVFVGSVRYRVPAEYPLWIAAAFGLLHFWPALRTWLDDRPPTAEAGP